MPGRKRVKFTAQPWECGCRGGGSGRRPVGSSPGFTGCVCARRRERSRRRHVARRSGKSPAQLHGRWGGLGGSASTPW